MQNILISGGSGLIGHKITQLLELKGYSVAWLSRSQQKHKSFVWDVEKQTIDPEAMDWADAVIHLAGAGVAEKRWTDERKKIILDSRIQSTRLLFDAIEKATEKPNTFISASAVGYYGFDTGTSLMDETNESGSDFLAQVVVSWENEVKKMEELHLRTVMLLLKIWQGCLSLLWKRLRYKVFLMQSLLIQPPIKNLPRLLQKKRANLMWELECQDSFSS